MDQEKIKSLQERIDLRWKEIKYYEELLEFSKREYLKELERLKNALKE